MMGLGIHYMTPDRDRDSPAFIIISASFDHYLLSHL